MKSKKKEKNNGNMYIESSYVKLTEKDYLENYIYSDELYNKITNYFNSSSDKPLYIGVIGSWGSGKTSIVETALNKVDNKTIVYRYDAWKYEGDSFRRSFIQSLLKQSNWKYKLNTDNKVYKRVNESLYEDYSISSNSIIERLRLSSIKDKKLNFVSISIVFFVSFILMVCGIYCIFNNNITFGDIATLVGALGIFNIFYSTTVYSKSKLFSSEQFYKSFTDILTEVKGDNNIILIDNLDRCTKEDLKETLNTIKGFYVENDELKIKKEKIVFIIPLDINSLEDAYSKNRIYYIDKIFDDTIYIKTKYNTDKLDFINRMLNEYPEINNIINPDSKSIIINSSISTPREIIKILNDYVTEYNLLVRKNGEEFAINEKNKNYLMKSIIIKRLYYDFYKLAYLDLENYKKYEKSISLYIDEFPLSEEIIDRETKNDLINFLMINNLIEPTDYYEFYQNQNIKSYNQIPREIRNAIMKQDIELILNYKDKDKIIDLYNNINDDFINSFWETNILNKYVTLIKLYNEKYFDSEEIKKIIESWDCIISSPEFIKINIENVAKIGFENELIFAKEISMSNKMNFQLLDSINNDKYKFNNEDEKYDMLSNWILKNKTIKLNDEYSDMINSFSEYILNNDLYDNEKYMNIFFSKNITMIDVNIFSQIIPKISNNDILFSFMMSMNENNMITDGIIDEFIIWISSNTIKNINIITLIIKILENNKKNLSVIKVNDLELTTPIPETVYINILDLYIKNNIYNQTLFNIIKSTNDMNLIKTINEKLTSKIPNNNNDFINNYISYYFSIPFDIQKDNLKYLAKVSQEYDEFNTQIVNSLINGNLLEDYYKTFEKAEQKELLIEKSINIIGDDLNKQINNLFVYESSSDRINKLLKEKSLEDKISIINKMRKIRLKNKIIKLLIDDIKEKDNITDEEIRIIKNLNMSKDDNEKLIEILNSKETINKELIGM